MDRWPNIMGGTKEQPVVRRSNSLRIVTGRVPLDIETSGFV